MLLIKNQRIFHNIATTYINHVRVLLSFLFLINKKSSFIGDFFISTTPNQSLIFTPSRSYYEKPCS